MSGSNPMTTRAPGAPLLRPISEEWDWQLHGACRSEDPELFFHPEGERGPSKRNRDAAAKQICAGCPVMATCAAHALLQREPYGVWGGMTEEDREAIYEDGGVRLPALAPLAAPAPFALAG